MVFEEHMRMQQQLRRRPRTITATPHLDTVAEHTPGISQGMVLRMDMRRVRKDQGRSMMTKEAQASRQGLNLQGQELLRWVVR
jgi:hypothetical protein